MKHATVHKAQVPLPATLFGTMFKTSSILPALHLHPCGIMWKQPIACQKKQANSHPNALRHTNVAKMTCQSSKWASEGCHCTVANIININTTHSSASSYMKPDFPSSFNLSLCQTGAAWACRLISPGVGRLRGSDMETVTLNNGAKMPMIGLLRPNISNFNSSPRIWWAMFFSPLKEDKTVNECQY